MVFDEVLFVAGRDICTKDITRIRGGWAIQDVFYVSIWAKPGHMYYEFSMTCILTAFIYTVYW